MNETTIAALITALGAAIVTLIPMYVKHTQDRRKSAGADADRLLARVDDLESDKGLLQESLDREIGLRRRAEARTAAVERRNEYLVEDCERVKDKLRKYEEVA
jgi:hypothetical protein